MKRKDAVRVSAKGRRLKPRNPLATAALMKKGGAHARQDRKASRARFKAELLKTTDGD
ncbi:hypothetical protein BSY238_1471 [Methyloversatilis sp. RAC08]|uniref:transposase n=1 Tax=Methyloversatilis sp. RAC08 TaxID=1842540 RepID=UPI00083DAF4C|nr:transposase [Methyloversatilis sp. RAC08]AOF82257.1 hypothetical protein BSY238_1471 [Methyloversatilis sp. RAC08]